MKFTHETLEKNIGWMALLIVLVVSVGGLVEIVPLFFQKSLTANKRKFISMFDTQTFSAEEGIKKMILQRRPSYPVQAERWVHNSTMSQIDYATAPMMARLKRKFELEKYLEFQANNWQ